MPSVRYFNQTAPFWDFVANMEEQGSNHPFFGGNGRGEASENEHERPNPWTEGWAGFPWGPFPHRGRHGPHPPPPPPPAHHEGPAPPAGPEGESEPEAGTSDEAQAARDGPHGGRREHGRHGHHGFHGQERGPHCRGGRGGRGWGRRHFHPYGGMGPLGGLAEVFQNQFFNSNNNTSPGTGDNNGNNEFTPDVDVFDAAEAFVIHVSLPGAKKEDIGVSWDAERSELAISGVVHRPGDEELLKTLALDERKVGAFERKVRLGSRANPAQVEADAIVARMEDGVLRVEVPKLDAGYVEIKKVDIE